MEDAMKPIIDATDKEAADLSARALDILESFSKGGLGAVATAVHLVSALRLLHQAANHEYRLELEAYLAENLEEMRKIHQ